MLQVSAKVSNVKGFHTSSLVSMGQTVEIQFLAQ